MAFSSMSDSAFATYLLFCAGLMMALFAASELSHCDRASRWHGIALALVVLGILHMLPGVMRLWIAALL